MFSILVALSGVIAVFLAAMGSLYTFIFGIAQVIGYAYITYSQGLYGEMLLNIAVFLPAQLFALYTWTRNSVGKQVTPKVLSNKGKLFFVIVIGIALMIYWHLIPFINASGTRSIGNLTVVISIFAQLFMILRFKEQWLLWLVANILNIILWLEIALLESNTANVTMLTMWCLYLLNNVFGYYYWRKTEGEKNK